MTIKDDLVEILATPSGPMRTCIFRPAAEGRYPGIVFYSEIFQITGPIRRMAAFLAGHGYVVAVPEVYHELEAAGTVLAYDQEGADRGNADKYGKELSSYDADARVVLEHLKSRADCTGKLGALGICLGGHLAFRAAMNPDVLATVCFYATDIHSGTLGEGQSDNSLAKMDELKAEAMFVWGRQDPHVPYAGREMIRARLEEVGSNYEWHEVNAQHAFLRDEGPRFDPALFLQAMTWTLAFYRRVLG